MTHEVASWRYQPSRDKENVSAGRLGMTTDTHAADGKISVRGWVGVAAALVLLVLGTAAADEGCQGRRALDPRTARLQVLDLQVGQQGIVGRVRNNSDETALGVGVWVNFYLSRRGGLAGQQCIPVGDLKAGDERPFSALPIDQALRAEAFDYAVDASGWR